ncbi:MAG TPA: GTP 3',8-cyclase MoaA, partial [Bacteroidota bacterium]|nr:GTP 3',8-cyclase MoaA [Bacteroidota bacterium]
FEEMDRLVRIFAGLGVEKIRLTGGEPLMRKDMPVLVHLLSHIKSIKDIALTTNGYFLAEQAQALVDAGLSRINVSMDSLDAVKFEKMTRRNYLDRVRDGLAVVEKLIPGPIKINAVLIRGINDDEIEQFADLARTKPYVIRFIEFMPIGSDDGWTIDQVVPAREVIERINAWVGESAKLMPLEYHGQHPADRYAFADGKGEIGFIASVSEPFCSSCNRVRITSDGKLRTCLFSLTETDLKSMVRGGASDEEISATIVAAVLEKEEGHLINRPGFVRPDRTMSAIGG